MLDFFIVFFLVLGKFIISIKIYILHTITEKFYSILFNTFFDGNFVFLVRFIKSNYIYILHCVTEQVYYIYLHLKLHCVKEQVYYTFFDRFFVLGGGSLYLFTVT